MLIPKIAALVMTIGQEVPSIKPYTTNKTAPAELTIRNLRMSFMVNDNNNTNDAK